MSYNLAIPKDEHEPILQKALQYWNNQEQDVFLLTSEGDSIGTHKLILSFYSSYLRNILNDPVIIFGSEIPSISVPASSSCMSSLINLLVTGEARGESNENNFGEKVRELANVLGITMDKVDQNLVKIKSEPDIDIDTFFDDIEGNENHNHSKRKVIMKKKENIIDKKPGPKKLGPHCKECEIIFKDVCYLHRHNRRKHGIYASRQIKPKVVKSTYSNNIKPACQTCGIEFKAIKYLYQHNRKIHGITILKKRRITSIKCDFCDSEFPQMKYLIRHKKREHRNFTDYKCDSCPKSFTSDIRLKQHLSIHLPDSEKLYKCDFCEKKYGEILQIKIHMKKMHSYVKEFYVKYEEFAGNY